MLTQDSLRAQASRTPMLTTPRLRLSRILPEDANDLYAFSKRRKVTRHLLWYPHPSRAHTRAYVRLLQEKYDSHEFFDWGVHEKDGRLIGTCGFASINETQKTAEIGYVFSPKVWGKGYAVEAARRVMDFGFRTLGLSSITARFMCENRRSERVMQKLGMKPDDTLAQSMYVKDRFRAILGYRITSEEFFNQK